MAPEISLIVCTRNRASQLKLCLDSISKLRSSQQWELVVVDNKSTDDTDNILDTFASSARFPVAIVKETRTGLASARNAGVGASRAPILAFIDDDCYPSPDFLERWLNVFVAQEIGFGGGIVDLHDPEDHAITISHDRDPRVIPPEGYIKPGLIQGANMAFRREVLYKVGGFDPVLGPGGVFNFEDLDMCSRALAAGYTGGFFAEPIVRHHHRRRALDEIEALQRSYSHGTGAYLASLVLRRQGISGLARDYARSLRGKKRSIVFRELLGAAHYTFYRLFFPRERPLVAKEIVNGGTSSI